MKRSMNRTKLGKFFDMNSVNQAAVSRKTGIRVNRLTDLATKNSAALRADELYLIALATNSDPCQLLEFLCGDLKLTDKESW